MDIAFMKYGRGEASLVTAEEVEERFDGKPPSRVRFFCPACNQKLIPCAMGRWYARRPYFSHEANNQNAQNCEYFVANMGVCGSAYQRAPLPMFIRRALGRQGQYVVEGGFAALPSFTLAMLERSGAELLVGTKRYRITESRFGSGITRLAFDEISLSLTEHIALSNSPLPLDSVWNYPESAARALIFTRDPDSNRGKRLRTGDTVPLGSDLFLLTPMWGLQTIEKAFPTSTRLGTAGAMYGDKKLQVVATTLPASGGFAYSAARYLESCGLRVGTRRDTFKLLWPPALVSGGEVEPIFEGRGPIISVPRSHSADGSVYLFTASLSQDETKSMTLRQTDNREYGVVEIGPASDSRVIAMKRDSLADSLLISPYDERVADMLPDDLPESSFCYKDGKIRLDLSSTAVVVRMSKKRGKTEEKIAQGGPMTLTPGNDEAISVRRRLNIPRDGYLSLFMHLGSDKAVESEGSHEVGVGGREKLLARHQSDGSKLAMRRLSNTGEGMQGTNDKLLAQIRRSQRGS